MEAPGEGTMSAERTLECRRLDAAFRRGGSTPRFPRSVPGRQAGPKKSCVKPQTLHGHGAAVASTSRMTAPTANHLNGTER